MGRGVQFFFSSSLLANEDPYPRHRQQYNQERYHTVKRFVGKGLIITDGLDKGLKYRS